jgi:hypothetical protein
MLRLAEDASPADRRDALDAALQAAKVAEDTAVRAGNAGHGWDAFNDAEAFRVSVRAAFDEEVAARIARTIVGLTSPKKQESVWEKELSVMSKRR